MKITKSRLREIILEELQNEVDLEEGAEGSRLGGDRARKQCESQGGKWAAGRCIPAGEELEEGAEGSRLGGDRARKQCESQGGKWAAGRCIPAGEELEEGSGDRNDADREQGRGPSRQKTGSAGNSGELEELRALIAQELKNLL